MPITHAAIVLMLLGNALWAGGTMTIAVERCAIWPRMTFEDYVVDFRRSLHRMDPLMPILGGVGLVGAVLLAVRGSGHAAAWAWADVALIAVVIIASVTIAEPINSKFRRLPEGAAPEGAEGYLRRWRRFHAARFAVALAALCCAALSVVS